MSGVANQIAAFAIVYEYVFTKYFLTYSGYSH